MTAREKLPGPATEQTQEIDRDGIHISMTAGFIQDGEIGEIFLNADRSDSMIDVFCAMPRSLRVWPCNMVFRSSNSPMPSNVTSLVLPPQSDRRSARSHYRPRRC